MIKIEEYILLPKSIRQAHLRLHVYWCTAAENRQDTLEKAKQLQNKARSLGITSKKEKAKETEHSRVQLLTLGGNSTSSNTSFAK